MALKSTDYSCHNDVMEGLPLLLYTTCTLSSKSELFLHFINIIVQQNFIYQLLLSVFIPTYYYEIILYVLRLLLFQELFQHNVFLPTCLLGHVRIVMVDLEVHPWHVNLIHHHNIYYFTLQYQCNYFLDKRVS